MTLPRTLLDEVASTAGGPERGTIELLSREPFSPSAAAQFNRTRAHTLDTIRALSPASADERPDAGAQLLTGALSRLLAAAVLATFPNSAVGTPTYVDRRDAHPATLRRAVAFIETNPDLDLTVIDIAGAAHVTPRTIQLAFRRHLDTTPMRYLRRVRLDRAHADLQTATPDDGTTVTVIAARWGYTASRFAAAYQAAYGRHPHEVLSATERAPE